MVAGDGLRDNCARNAVKAAQLKNRNFLGCDLETVNGEN